MPTCCTGCLERLEASLRDAAEMQRARKIHETGLPADYASGKRTWDDAPAWSSVVKARLALEAMVRGQLKRPGVYLHGRAGRFKTTLAAGFLATELATGRSGVYEFWPEFLTRLNSAEYGNREAILAPLKSTHLLVLDDLDKTILTDAAARTLLEILDARYRTGSGYLVVTANVTIPNLARMWDERVGERVGEPIERRLGELCVPVGLSEDEAVPAR